MTPVLTLRVALRALVRNKLRAFLTTLGVMIGVGAVIAMVAIGEGARSRVEETFAAMGTNLLIVLSGSTTSGGVHGGFGSQPTLTWEDLEAIRNELTTVRRAAAASRATVIVAGEEQNWTTSVTGATPEYFDVRAWQADRGTVYGDAEQESGAKVVVLGKTVADRLYGEGADPVGRTVRIRNVPFTVIGRLASKGQSPMGQDYDDTAVVPFSTFASKLQGGLKQYVAGAIMVSAASSAVTAKAQRDIEALLRERHRIEPGDDDDFSIRNLAEVAGAQQEGTRTLTALLAAIAAVSLLVGGIGIMNIMLVSVTERTREIGVRMAVGAKPRHILAQFLVEALVLSLAGGLIGVGAGVLAAERLAEAFRWPLLLRPDAMIAAVAFSAAVGVVFGLYPAVKASRLDPIEALRYE
ncbi:MAG: ABC transporter permease [Deltaproteobacteria bacterium]|nr:ABC transporter permease [Deltaproteobacteria bacterium]